MAELSGHGLTLKLPRGWHGEIARRTGSGALPVLHAATLPLPPDRADSGGVLVERLGWNDIFVSLIEHEPSGSPSPLFAGGLSLPLEPASFVTRTLQGMRPFQSGTQRFFTEQSRAFCLFVVVGEHVRRARLLREVNKILSTLVIDPSPGGDVGAVEVRVYP